MDKKDIDKGAYSILSYGNRWYSKNHRRQFVETSWFERLGEQILDGIAKHNLKAFELGHAVLNHLQANQDFYKEVK